MDILFFGNGIVAWSQALAVVVVVWIGLAGLQRMLGRRLARFAAKTETYLDDLALEVLAVTSPLFLFLLALVAGTYCLELPPRATRVVGHLAVASCLLQAARWADVGLHSWLHRYRLDRNDSDGAATTSTAALDFIARSALWLIVVLMILDNVGVNITTLIASLGVGGIAVALALQNILGDLFSSLSIVLDKPFVVGDFITVDEIAGTVEYVGLKTTRIRGLGGEQVVFSNSDLLKSRIRNYKRMQTRRVVFGVGVTYETEQEKLDLIPGIMKEIVTSQRDASFDRAHFKAFGDSALQFEIVYYVTTPDYTRYMDIQQEINLGIVRRFEREAIAFAYPTTTVRFAGP